MQQILKRVKRVKWTRLVSLLPVLFGFASCDICGGSVRGDGTNRCTQYDMVSAMGLPFGPVNVTWNPTDGIDQYRVVISSKYGDLGQTITDWQQTSATVTLDQTLVNQTMAGDGVFTISGFGALSNGYGVGDCEFDRVIAMKKAEKKKIDTPIPKVPAATYTPIPKAPAATYTPIPKVTLAPPPKLAATPTSTFIPMILVPLVTPCPRNMTGTPPNCLAIPR